MTLRQRGYLIEGGLAKKVWRDFIGDWHPWMSEKETRAAIARSKARELKRDQGRVSSRSLDPKKKDVYWAAKLAGKGSGRAENVSRELDRKEKDFKKNWKKMSASTLSGARKRLGDIVDQLDDMVAVLKHVG